MTATRLSIAIAALTLSACATPPAPSAPTAASDPAAACRDAQLEAAAFLSIADSASADCERNPGPHNDACIQLIASVSALQANGAMTTVLGCMRDGLLSPDSDGSRRLRALVDRIAPRTQRLADQAEAKAAGRVSF